MGTDSYLAGRDWFVLVAGCPGSGKTTLAAALATELGLPLLSQDEIKEALMDGLGWPETVAQSRQLGRAEAMRSGDANSAIRDWYRAVSSAACPAHARVHPAQAHLRDR